MGWGWERRVGRAAGEKVSIRSYSCFGLVGSHQCSVQTAVHRDACINSYETEAALTLAGLHRVLNVQFKPWVW